MVQGRNAGHGGGWSSRHGRSAGDWREAHGRGGSRQGSVIGME